MRHQSNNCHAPQTSITRVPENVLHLQPEAIVHDGVGHDRKTTPKLCISVCVCVYNCVCVCALTVYVYNCMCTCITLSVQSSVFMAVHLLICLFACPTVCVSVYVTLRLSVCLSVCSSASVFVTLSLPLSASVSICQCHIPQWKCPRQKDLQVFISLHLILSPLHFPLNSSL